MTNCRPPLLVHIPEIRNVGLVNAGAGGVGSQVSDRTFLIAFMIPCITTTIMSKILRTLLLYIKKNVNVATSLSNYSGNYSDLLVHKAIYYTYECIDVLIYVSGRHYS